MFESGILYRYSNVPPMSILKERRETDYRLHAEHIKAAGSRENTHARDINIYLALQNDGETSMMIVNNSRRPAIIKTARYSLVGREKIS